MNKTKEELASEYFKSNNCCQAVLRAFKDEAGLTEKDAVKLGSTFGGGMGGMQGTCGALVGAEMILALTGFEGKPMGAKAKELYSKFVEMTGSGICKEIKGVETGEMLASCDTCVRNAAHIFQDIAGDTLAKKAAEAITAGTVAGEVSTETTIASLNYEKTEVLSNNDAVVAYVDGSYNISTKEYSYGVVAFVGDEKKTFAEKFNDPELATMRNVAGELEGAKKAMSYALSIGARILDIYYDYEGIEKWCTGAWKTNKEGTKAYKAFYDSVSGKLNVHFHKVKGHSGDRYNDEADALAKAQLGI